MAQTASKQAGRECSGGRRGHRSTPVGNSPAIQSKTQGLAVSAERLDCSAASADRREATGALAALCRNHHGELVRLALYRMGDESRSEEVVQEVYRRVVQEPTGFLQAKDILAYARAAVRREAEHVSARAASERKALEALKRDPLRTPPRTPEEEARARALKAAIRGAVASLPSKQREAVTRVKLNGMRHKEAAEVMGCATGTVKVHLRSALAALRRSELLHRITGIP